MDDKEEWSDSEWDEAEVMETSDLDIEEIVDLGATRTSAGETFRVQENIARRIGSCSGGTDCGQQGRAVRELRPHHDRWVAETIARHPNDVALFKGYNGRIRWQLRMRWPDRIRCRGWFDPMNAYVDFQRGGGGQ